MEHQDARPSQQHGKENAKVIMFNCNTVSIDMGNGHLL